MSTADKTKKIRTHGKQLREIEGNVSFNFQLIVLFKSV